MSIDAIVEADLWFVVQKPNFAAISKNETYVNNQFLSSRRHDLKILKITTYLWPKN